MANTIRIKRRSTGSAGAPTTLENAELAYNEVDDVLYYGKGTGGAGGTATTIPAIAGPGAYATLATTQTISGNKTFSGDIAVPTQASGDNSTKAASTAFVKNQNYITGNQTITVSGDASGSGTTAISLTLASVGTAGTYTKVTTDAKGRVTAGTTLAASDIPTLTASKISDFDTQVRTSRLDQMAAPTTSVSFNNQKITNLATPTDASDACTKGYADSLQQGLDVKASCRVATTANITLSGTQTIDGVAVIAGDRVLVKNQSTASANGIYVVAAGAWTRATDADANAEVTAGMFTFVSEGTSNGDTGWVLTTNDTITLGTTALTFTQFSGAGSITAGDGLTQSGSTINAVGTANRISVSADAIDIASTYVGQTSITTLGTVTSGTWNATAIAVARGGTGATDAATARTNLGLAIGTNVQAYDADLATLSGMQAGAATALAALTSSEVAIIDGSTSATATTLASTDRMVINDGGTMVQVALSDLVTFFENGTASGFDIDGGTF